MRTKQEEIALINQKQNEYIDELIHFIETHKEEEVIPFTSPTGTGKTRMMDKLINSAFGQKYFFIITSLSRGGLYKQIEASLNSHCLYNNYKVYGSSEITAVTIFRPEDAWKEISEASKGKPLIWIRDEGHLQTNSWSKLLKNKVEYIINFSATNAVPGIECDFSETCMLRTPQLIQSPKVADALDKLLEIKKQHAGIPHYNPCAIFRCINNSTLHDAIIKECAKRNLSVIDLNEDDEVQLADICKDDNPYDVIINKMKIVEGVDLRRAHVAYLGNVPTNPDTIIQFMGRCRRNALLWRNDIDILDEKNRELLEATRDCYIYFNVANQEQQETVEDLTARLHTAFRNVRSVLEFKVGTKLSVIDGKTENGISIYQLQGCTGDFVVEQDAEGYKVANPLSAYYHYRTEHRGGYIPSSGYKITESTMFGKQVVGYYDNTTGQIIPLSQYFPYSIVTNDYESARLGGEFFKYYGESKSWTEVRTVTSLIDKTSGLACKFIENKYAAEFREATAKIKEEQLSSGNNHFDFNPICNKCLGWMVEFYTKYLLFGSDFLSAEICQAQSEAPESLRHSTDTPIIFYACFIKYRNIMKRAFGDSVVRYIKGPSITDYIKESYQSFVSTVVELATKTKAYLDSLSLTFTLNGKLFDENLSIEHLTGKADFVSEDTIIDLKTTNNITPRYVRQVLLYHYLSTKRSDLNIKRVIIYDCVSGHSLEINIKKKNLTSYYQPALIGSADDSHLPEKDVKRLKLEDAIRQMPCKPLKDRSSYIFIKPIDNLKLTRETKQSQAAREEIKSLSNTPIVSLSSYADKGRAFLKKCISQGLCLSFSPLSEGLFFVVNDNAVDKNRTYYSEIWNTCCNSNVGITTGDFEILRALLPGHPVQCGRPALQLFLLIKIFGVESSIFPVQLAKEKWEADPLNKNGFFACISEDENHYYTLEGTYAKNEVILYKYKEKNGLTTFFVHNNIVKRQQRREIKRLNLIKVSEAANQQQAFYQDEVDNVLGTPTYGGIPTYAELKGQLQRKEFYYYGSNSILSSTKIW